MTTLQAFTAAVTIPRVTLVPSAVGDVDKAVGVQEAQPSIVVVGPELAEIFLLANVVALADVDDGRVIQVQRLLTFPLIVAVV